MANCTAQGVYAPLPQSISDSDSEKELQMDPIRTSFSDCKTHNGGFTQDNFTGNGCVLPRHRYDSSLKPQKLSTLRKIAFVLSICMCFLTICVFLWGLPCSGTCPVKVSNWETQHEGIELKGIINVVTGVFQNKRNLATLFKKNIFIPSASNGVVSILGRNGGVAWYISQAHQSDALNCTIIDVNGDGVVDCLLLGELGLEAIDPISGTIFWHARGTPKDNLNDDINKQEFPVALPDFNGDMIGELLTSAKNGEDSSQNKLVMFCGKTGSLVAEFVVKECTEVHVIKRVKDNILYLCVDKHNASYYEISLNNLRDVMMFKSTDFKMNKSNYPGDDTQNVSVLNKKRLTIDNKGECPECRANVVLFDTVLSKELLTWSYSNTYAMKPQHFSFKSTKNTMTMLKGHVNGFILKLWQWPEYNTKKKMEKYKHKTPIGNTTKNNINERVVLITFNDTNVHIINASLTPIVQLCLHLNGTSVECQPDKNNQENSLLVTDIDGDNSQELISYSSSFIYHDGTNASLADKTNWQLVSYMKIIRLEAELPKLYEDTK